MGAFPEKCESTSCFEERFDQVLARREFPKLGGSCFASLGDDQLEERSLYHIAIACIVHLKPLIAMLLYV